VSFFNPPPWMIDGYCNGANPEIFEEDALVETAKAYCSRCVVRVTCLDWALTNGETGVWGGTTESERRALLRGGKRASCPSCGGTQLFDDGRSKICIPCGMSWLI
jgi:WhiB family transcriptional regulator, redox-sensing transcriptional regulator